MRRRQLTTGTMAITGVLVLALQSCTTPPEPAPTLTYSVQLQLAGEPAQGQWNVGLWVAGQTEAVTSTSAGDGAAVLSVPDGTITPTDTVYITATRTDATIPAGEIILASLLGQDVPSNSDLVVNELTTVAAGYSLAQFWQVTGGAPYVKAGATGDASYDLEVGIPNAARMARNIATLTGAASYVLLNGPNVANAPLPPKNSLELYVRGKVNTLANLVQITAMDPTTTDQWFGWAQEPSSENGRSCVSEAVDSSDNTMIALANMARYPFICGEEIYALSQQATEPLTPVYPWPAEKGFGSWILPLLFDGTVSPDGPTDVAESDLMDGPGNFAIDYEGSIWIGNNYTYGSEPGSVVCQGQKLMRLEPDGTYYPGSPYMGANLWGVGYGIAINEVDNSVWPANFGFRGPTCVRPTPHGMDQTVSKFASDGTAIGSFPQRPKEDFAAPQGLSYNGNGAIFAAGCGSNTVGQFGVDGESIIWTPPVNMIKPFDLAYYADRSSERFGVWVSANATPHSDSSEKPGGVFHFDAFGKLERSYTDSVVSRPMGIEVSRSGYVWVAASEFVDVPCTGATPITGGTAGHLIYLAPTASSFVRANTEHRGGVVTPWGLTIDTNDDVWVANFDSGAVSHYCGRTSGCVAGLSLGDPYPTDGYHFEGFHRLTGVKVDPSGNLWITNNWDFAADQSTPNPGGKQVVAFVGSAPPQRGAGKPTG